MKSFKSYISEEVLPTANVENGNFDIENEAVRSQVNGTLAAVVAQPAVTPYVLLRKVSKALSYFHIILPKRTFLEGTKGVEVYEVMQFGDRMGMTDAGEFVREVPEKYYLFFQYGIAHPFNVTYTKPNIDGMYRGMAKIVDKAELDRLLSAAESMMAESCDDKATMSQRKAGREEIQTNGNHGTPSTDKAMDTSGEKSADVDKKWPAVVKEAMTRKQKVRSFMSHDPEAAERILKMGKKEREEKKSFASAKKEIKRLKEEQIDEASYEKLDNYVRDAHVSGTGAAARGEIAMHRGQKTRLHRANKTGEKREQGINLALDKMAGRALVPAKRKEKMEEEYEKVEAGVKKRPGETHTLHRRNPGHKTEYHTITTDRDGRKSVKTGNPKYIKKHWDKLEEKHLTPPETRKKEEIVMSMKKGLPGFKERYGKRAKEVMYATATKRAKEQVEEGMAPIKKSYAMRKMKKKVSTQVKQGLGVGKEKTSTILVTNKGDPKAASGGGVHRIPRDKYDPSKHNLASE